MLPTCTESGRRCRGSVKPVAKGADTPTQVRVYIAPCGSSRVIIPASILAVQGSAAVILLIARMAVSARSYQPDSAGRRAPCPWYVSSNRIGIRNKLAEKPGAGSAPAMSDPFLARPQDARGRLASPQQGIEPIPVDAGQLAQALEEHVQAH